MLQSFYNDTRSRYYRELDEASRRHNGHLGAFLDYAVYGFRDQLLEQLKPLVKEQELSAWRDYVEERLNTVRSTAVVRARRKQLACELAEFGRSGLHRDHVLRDTSNQLVRLYGDRTTKTVTRDINALIKLGLVRACQTRESENSQWVDYEKHIRASIEHVRAMRPYTNLPDHPLPMTPA